MRPILICQIKKLVGRCTDTMEKNTDLALPAHIAAIYAAQVMEIKSACHVGTVM